MRESMRALLRKATWRTLLAAALLSLGVAVAAATAQEPPQQTPPQETSDEAAPPAETPASTSGGEILLHPPSGGEPIPISLADVEGSIRTTYTIRDADGEEREVEVTPENGASVDDILRAAGFDDGYVFLDVERADGTTLRLSRTRVRSGQGQQGLTPVIFVDENGINFLRPLSGPDDENASDLVTVAGGALELRQTVSSDSRLKIVAKPRKAPAGEPIEFTAEVLEGGFGDHYEYRWAFGDGGKRGRGPTVEREFEEPGRYNVLVEASNLDDFVTGRVVVQVGKPKDGGPDREGGGENEDDAAPVTGTFDGGGSSYDYGGYDYGGSSYDDGSGSSYSTPDYSSPPSPPTPGYGSPSTASPPPASTEPTVAGNLLADISTPPSSSTADAASAARAGTPTEPDEPIGVPMAAWAAGGAIGLLFVGAGLESGRMRRLRIPRLPRR